MKKCQILRYLSNFIILTNDSETNKLNIVLKIIHGSITTYKVTSTKFSDFNKDRSQTSPPSSFRLCVSPLLSFFIYIITFTFYLFEIASFNSKSFYIFKLNDTISEG